MRFDKIIPSLEEIDGFGTDSEILAAIHSSPYKSGKLVANLQI
jgi:hypothetical protein